MLKVRLDEKEQSIEGAGSVVELCADVGCLIKVIYDGLESKDCKEFFKESFKESLKEFINEEIFAMDHNELRKACKEKKKEKDKEKQKQEDEQKELLETARKLIEKLKKMGALE